MLELREKILRVYGSMYMYNAHCTYTVHIYLYLLINMSSFYLYQQSNCKVLTLQKLL